MTHLQEVCNASFGKRHGAALSYCRRRQCMTVSVVGQAHPSDGSPPRCHWRDTALGGAATNYCGGGCEPHTSHRCEW